MARELSGKVALVTGAGRGLGRAIAEQLASAGASIVLADLEADEGNGTAQAIRDSGAKATFVKCDAGREVDCARSAEVAIDEYGRLDVFVGNAGVHTVAPAADMPLEQFRALCRVNLKGAYLGLKHAVIAMRKHGEGGAVVLISSIASEVGLSNHTHYCASKGGVKLMAKAAALELGPESIRVNSVHPGGIQTRMTAFADPVAFSKLVPLGRMGVPEDISQAVLFLASPRGRFVTGAELIVDGGMMVMQ